MHQCGGLYTGEGNCHEILPLKPFSLPTNTGFLTLAFLKTESRIESAKLPSTANHWNVFALKTNAAMIALLPG